MVAIVSALLATLLAIAEGMLFAADKFSAASRLQGLFLLLSIPVSVLMAFTGWIYVIRRRVFSGLLHFAFVALFASGVLWWGGTAAYKQFSAASHSADFSISWGEMQSLLLVLGGLLVASLGVAVLDDIGARWRERSRQRAIQRKLALERDRLNSPLTRPNTLLVDDGEDG